MSNLPLLLSNNNTNNFSSHNNSINQVKLSQIKSKISYKIFLTNKKFIMSFPDEVYSYFKITDKELPIKYT